MAQHSDYVPTHLVVIDYLTQILHFITLAVVYYLFRYVNCLLFHELHQRLRHFEGTDGDNVLVAEMHWIEDLFILYNASNVGVECRGEEALLLYVKDK